MNELKSDFSKLEPIEITNKVDSNEDDFSFPYFTFFIFLGLIGYFFFYGYFYYSPTIQYISNPCVMSSSYNQSSVDISFSVNGLSKFNSFIKLDLVISRYATFAITKVKYHLNYTVNFLKNGVKVRQEKKDLNLTGSYTRFIDSLQARTILYKKITDFDEIVGTSTLYTNLTSVSSVYFHYFYANENFIKLMKTSSLILTVFSVFSFYQYYNFYQKSQKTFFDQFLYVLGISCSLSTNFLSLLIDNKLTQYLYIILMNAYIAIFRSFSMYLLDSMYKKVDSITPAINEEILILIIQMILQTIHDCSRDYLFFSEYDNSQKTIGLLDIILYFLHFRYIFVCLLWFKNTIPSLSKKEKIRCLSYGCFILLTLINTLIIQIMKIMKNPKSNGLSVLAYHYPYVISGIIFLSYGGNTNEQYRVLHDSPELNCDENTIDEGLILSDKEEMQ